MKRFSFKKGLVFIEQENRWQLQRRLVTGKLQFESELGEIKTYWDKEIHQLWATNEWILDHKTLGSHADVIYLATPRDLSTFPEKWQNAAVRRLHYIECVLPPKVATQYHSK